MPAGNSGFALWGLTCLVETFVVKQTFVLRMNISAKNSPQRKAANRYKQLYVLNFVLEISRFKRENGNSKTSSCREKI
jgi:hypothetical protein